MGRIAHKYFDNHPDGTKVIVRAAYTPEEFSVPLSEMERLRSIPSGYGSLDILDEYDGELSRYHVIRRFERDDKKWILLQSPMEYAIEVELTRSQMGEIRCVPPEDAWRLARELDKAENRYLIEVEPGSPLP